MKRAILIDGNNLVFRSYYATAYNNQLMRNSKGFPTNAVYGFISMINKIMQEENPEYIVVAFDKGHNFRKDLYKDYKAGRIETPNDLVIQFPYAKKALDALGIKHLDFDNYEADDIIGSFAKMADIDNAYDATIISSDKDLLQLISNDVDVKLLKQGSFIKYDTKTFYDEYKFDPIRIIDLKALMGDSSDNIPGVKGVGEKTGLSLIQRYDTIENLYDNIDDIKGKLKEKLTHDKDMAFFSKKLATIYKDIDLNMTFEDIKTGTIDNDELKKLYEELEFYSLLKKMDGKEEVIESTYKLYDKKYYDSLGLCSLYIELDGENYHSSNMLGASIYDGKNLYYLDKQCLIDNVNILSKVSVTYDNKKNIVYLNSLNIKMVSSAFDTMIASYLLEYNFKDDIAYLASSLNYKIEFYSNIINKKKPIDENIIIDNICKKAVFLYNTKKDFVSSLSKEGMLELYNNIELPLVEVLSDMEITGVYVDKAKINELKEEIIIRLDNLKRDIYNIAGEEFNISSPLQLGKILFEKLGIRYPKKHNKVSYSTDKDTLLKVKNDNIIIQKILLYKENNKILTTYMDSLLACIMDDNKIHTIYKQTIARTGRLSSIEPNLQNIPVRSEEGKKVRKAFISSNGIFVSSDYSQIELRILAHLSKDSNMINTFINDEDIHNKVACDIFNKESCAITKNDRRTAKAVIFGIVYGISGYGLGENLEISPVDAKKFIDKYLEMYPRVKEYMENIVNETKEKGYVTTLLGRKRIINELHNTNYMIRQSGERMALNTPTQGTSADIIKKAMVMVYNRFNTLKLRSKMIMQVHDELIFDVYKEEKDIVEKTVKEVMENAYILDVPLKVEIEEGISWYEC
ncbi:MAG: DNA polymerase I [Bacilli bacterium]